jgi:radical SAM superfamily enzyme YgiQ (UPF0313 family)
MEQLADISPSSIFIAGGQCATFIPEKVFENSPISIIIKGWGEFALEQILAVYDGTQRLSEKIYNIPGLYIKLRNGDIIETSPRLPYTLDEFRAISLSFDFSLVPYDLYWTYMEDQYTEKQLCAMGNADLVKTVRLITSSHCASGCLFCSSTNLLDNTIGNRQTVLRLSANDIVVLMKRAAIAWPDLTAFYFNDDNFVDNKARIYDLADQMEVEFGTRKWNLLALSRVDNIDPLVLTRMREVGFRLLIFGVESFSNTLLCDMNKRTTADRSEQVIKWTLEAGIRPFINLIMFYPTSKIDDIVMTIDRTVDLMASGARVAVNNYALAFSGSKITQAGYKILDDLSIAPIADDVRALAVDAVKLQPSVLAKILEKNHITENVIMPLGILSRCSI